MGIMFCKGKGKKTGDLRIGKMWLVSLFCCLTYREISVPTPPSAICDFFLLFLTVREGHVGAGFSVVFRREKKQVKETEAVRTKSNFEDA